MRRTRLCICMLLHTTISAPRFRRELELLDWWAWHRSCSNKESLIKWNHTLTSWYFRALKRWSPSCSLGVTNPPDLQKKKKKMLLENLVWSFALCMLWKQHWNIYIWKTLWAFSITETKPVERSQNSGDLYATWYTKYERSACTVGGGVPLIVQQAANADKMQ